MKSVDVASQGLVGLGLASARPDHSVLVITGDGEMLMGLGSLATIAVRNPRNLTIAVLDNGQYGETGMQPSHAGQGVALEKVAASCGFSWTADIRDIAGVDRLREMLADRGGAVPRTRPACCPRATVSTSRTGSAPRWAFRRTEAGTASGSTCVGCEYD